MFKSYKLICTAAQDSSKVQSSAAEISQEDAGWHIVEYFNWACVHDFDMMANHCSL